jgi:manganese efflux pump family protein
MALTSQEGRRGGRAAMMVVTGAVLAGVGAGCSGTHAVARGSVSSCLAFGESAIQHHVTVTTVPPACQGLSHAEVNQAMIRALRAAAAGVQSRVRQRELIGRDIRYVSALIRPGPTASQPAVAAAPPPSPATPSPAAPGPAASSPAALSLAALATWLLTIGLGTSMMARWITRTRPGLGAARNFAHLGLAVTGLGIWIGYLATGVAGLAWAGCGLLIAAASLGMTLVFLAPARDPGTSLGGDPARDPGTSLGGDPARDPGTSEGRPPPALLVGVHITAAVVTILLATLAAAGSV